MYEALPGVKVSEDPAPSKQNDPFPQLSLIFSEGPCSMIPETPTGFSCSSFH